MCQKIDSNPIIWKNLLHIDVLNIDVIFRNSWIWSLMLWRQRWNCPVNSKLIDLPDEEPGSSVWCVICSSLCHLWASLFQRIQDPQMTDQPVKVINNPGLTWSIFSVISRLYNWLEGYWGILEFQVIMITFKEYKMPINMNENITNTARAALVMPLAELSTLVPNSWTMIFLFFLKYFILYVFVEPFTLILAFCIPTGKVCIGQQRL